MLIEENINYDSEVYFIGRHLSRDLNSELSWKREQDYGIKNEYLHLNKHSKLQIDKINNEKIDLVTFDNIMLRSRRDEIDKSSDNMDNMNMKDKHNSKLSNRVNYIFHPGLLLSSPNFSVFKIKISKM